MNLVDCVVDVVLTEPAFAYNKWWIVVKYNSWGRFSDCRLMFDTKEEALAIKPGHKFLA